MIIKDLFSALISDFKLIPKSFYNFYPIESNERVVCDYISGMTDSFAVSEHKQLLS